MNVVMQENKGIICVKVVSMDVANKDLRERLQLDPDILTGGARTWSKTKNVVADYLNKSEVWVEQPQQFVSLLQRTLYKISTHLNM